MSLNAYARTAAQADMALELRRHFDDHELPGWALEIPAHDVTASGIPTSHATRAFYDLCRMWGISDEAADRLYWDARADLEARL